MLGGPGAGGWHSSKPAPLLEHLPLVEQCPPAQAGQLLALEHSAPGQAVPQGTEPSGEHCCTAGFIEHFVSIEQKPSMHPEHAPPGLQWPAATMAAQLAMHPSVTVHLSSVTLFEHFRVGEHCPSTQPAHGAPWVHDVGHATPQAMLPTMAQSSAVIDFEHFPVPEQCPPAHAGHAAPWGHSVAVQGSPQGTLPGAAHWSIVALPEHFEVGEHMP